LIEVTQNSFFVNFPLNCVSVPKGDSRQVGIKREERFGNEEKSLTYGVLEFNPYGVGENEDDICYRYITPTEFRAK
jgi:hypothetical protein